MLSFIETARSLDFLSVSHGDNKTFSYDSLLSCDLFLNSALFLNRIIILFLVIWNRRCSSTSENAAYRNYDNFLITLDIG
jgi:hypothetical protein